MKLISIILALALVCLASSFADTQKIKAASASLKASTQTSAEVTTASGVSDKPRPSSEMKKLIKMMAGKWQVEEKFEVSQWMPKGGEGKGAEMIHRGPGGLSLISNYKSAGAVGDYKGNGIISWSPEDKAYKSFWVDNGMAGGSYSLGKWNGNDLVFTSTQDMNGQQLPMKMTYSNFTGDAFTVTLDFGPVGGELKPFMTIKLTKIPRAESNPRRRGMGMVGRPSLANPFLDPSASTVRQ